MHVGIVGVLMCVVVGEYVVSAGAKPRFFGGKE